MFNFTYHSGNIKAQFNGRFAYRADDSGAALTPQIVRHLTSGSSEAWKNDSVRHEYFHWRVFKSSSFGKALIGRRFLVRVAFSRFGKIAPVESYYRARTCFFFCVYDAHENIVTEIDEEREENIDVQSLAGFELSDEQRNAIKKADTDAIELLQELGLKRFKPLYLLDILLGIIFTKEYGLQYYEYAEGDRPRLKEASMKSWTGGMINAAFTGNEPGDRIWLRALKWLRRQLNTELGTKALSHSNLCRWTLVKLRAEYQTLVRIYTLRSGSMEGGKRKAIADYQERCAQNTRFICDYTLLGADDVTRVAYARILVACATGHFPNSIRNPSEEELVRVLETLDHAFVYFFYSHGN